MKPIVRFLIDGPEWLAGYLAWLGPLAARIVVGWVFLWTGWEKLSDLPAITKNFVEWGIPFPHLLTPFASGAEFVCGALLLVGLFTRFAAPALVIVMIVAIAAAKWDAADSLETFFGFEEVSYMAIFGWLGVAGPGKVSLDYLLQRVTGSKSGAEASALATQRPADLRVASRASDAA